MKSRICRALFISIMAALPGCASTMVIEQTPTVQESITRPNQIWIYDFVATPRDLSSDFSSLCCRWTDCVFDGYADRYCASAGRTDCARSGRRYSSLWIAGYGGKAGVVTPTRR